MSIESLLYDRLKDSGGALFPLVGLRIYPVSRPQNATFPAVTWQRITAGRETAMGSDPGIVRARIQIDCWAATFDSCRAVAEAVRTQLQRWRSAGPPIVQDVFYISETDEFDEEAELFRTLIEVELIHEET